MKAIIGKKVGMSQIFDENGKVIPVTVIVSRMFCYLLWCPIVATIPVSFTGVSHTATPHDIFGHCHP